MITALDFGSSSFTLRLDPHNSSLSSVFSSNNTTIFNVLVDYSGSSPNPFDLLSMNPGSFQGSLPDLSLVHYTNVDLSPDEGGFFLAELTIVAELVPEPSSWNLLFLGLVPLLLMALRSRKMKDGTSE